MNFVIQQVHQPGRQEGGPPNDDHHPDLVLCQHMGGAIDVNQPHLGSHTYQCRYCQPGYKTLVQATLLNGRFSLPQVECGHEEEIYSLLYQRGLMLHFFHSHFLCEYWLKVELIIRQH